MVLKYQLLTFEMFVRILHILYVPLYFSITTLKSRFHDMWANSPFSYEAERARIEKIRAERGQRRPSNTQRYEQRKMENKYLYIYIYI